MSWNTATPAGSEPANQGDDVIRALKSDLQSAFRAGEVDGLVAVFPGADLANPVYEYRGRRGSTAARPASGEGGFYIDTTRNALQRDSGASWDDVATLIPSGTVMVFYQVAAPIGWTKIVTQHDKALRVVSGGGGGSGGSALLSSAISLVHSHTVTSHQHTISHRHTTPVGFVSGSTIFAPQGADWVQGSELVTAAGVSVAGSNFGSTGLLYAKTKDADNTNSGGAAPSTDSQLTNVSLAYIDVIVASKD